MSEDLKAQNKEKDLEYLYKRREALDAHRIALSNAFDKYLFTASSSALALLVAFTKDLKPIHTEWLLWVSAVAFISALIFTLLSILMSVKSFSKQMDITDRQITAAIKDVTGVCADNIYNIIVRWFTILAMVSFVIGTAAAICFFFINIK